MNTQVAESIAVAQQDTSIEATLASQFDRDLREGRVELPLLPATAMRVFQAARRPEAAAADVAELVQADQKLAGAVLRVANSAAHSPRNPIVTLQQAITRLGLKSMAEIALGEAFRSSVYDDDDNFELMVRYWRESLATALWAKELARVRRENVETAYLCGLMHNVGKPLALRYIDANVKGIDDATQVPDLVETLARASGPFLSDAWNMPAVVAHSLAWYHDYVSAPEYRNEAAIVQGALALGCWSLDYVVPEDGEDENSPPDLEVFGYLNLYADQMQALVGKRESILLQIESFESGG